MSIMQATENSSSLSITAILHVVTLRPVHTYDADDTLFRKVRYSSHHLLHTLLPEQTTHSYHLRSRTHS